MTHTLHRRTELLEKYTKKHDFVILCMACQGYNDKGAKNKLREIFKLVAKSNPDNLADDNLGGRLTGYNDTQILEHMGDKAYIGAAFSDSERLSVALRLINEANLGMSVVVTGNYDEVFRVLNETNLEAHTVNMSLGVFGKKEKLPEEDILSVVTMCGHGMVTPQHVRHISDQVEQDKISAEEGSRVLSTSCTCGIFNPVLAASSLKNFKKEE